MANLTVTVDEQVLRRARVKALERGTSVNALVSDYLARVAGMAGTERALADFLEIAQDSQASSGARGRTWTREDLYDRPVLRAKP